MSTIRPGAAEALGLRRAAPGIFLMLAACVDAPPTASPPTAVPPLLPAIVAAWVTPSPYQALGAVVSVRVEHADSVAVRFHLADAEPADSLTPAVPVLADSADIPVLGLLPARPYELRAIAYGKGGSVVGEPLALTTDTLPSDLPGFVAGGTDPSPGLVVFAAGRYGLAIDNTGRVVWYRGFTNGPGLNFQVQPTGRYTVRPPTPDPNDREPWIELDALGNVTRTFNCAGGLLARFHDLIEQDDGAYWIMCDETRTMDLSNVGGLTNAQVTGTVIQHVSASGELLFQWSPFDHFAITDVDAASRAGAVVNWTHGNALVLDTDGNLLVSFRSLSEITKIDTRTGDVLWRLGGLRNQFTFTGTSMPAFARQHGLRLTGAGDLLLLDNLGDPQASRAERYRLDASQHAAQLIASYASSPAVTAQLGGTTQELPGGRTLVAYGNGGRVEEYDAADRVVWRIEGNPGYIFRAQRIHSLYHPGVDPAR